MGGPVYNWVKQYPWPQIVHEVVIVVGVSVGRSCCRLDLEVLLNEWQSSRRQKEGVVDSGLAGFENDFTE